MTDNAIELLRKLLDERGVKWTSKPTRPETTWAHNGWWYNAKFEPWSDSTFKVILYDLTPEQAIAATLGSQIDADLRKAIDFMRIWIAEDAHLGESAISRELEKAEGLRKLDAIENAIAATMGAEYHGYEQAAIEAWESIKAWNTRATHGTLTAEQVREAIEANSWAETSSVREFNDSSWQAIADELNARAERTCHAESDLSEWVCSNCQCWIPLGLTPENIKHASEWRYCPHCGARVKAAKQ